MSSPKQHALVLQELRELILRGVLKPGERVTEAALAQRLGHSRMPVRQSLPMLAKEGLLVASGARGFAVRAFTRAECVSAIRLRAALEGLAAKEVAERGLPPALESRFAGCLAEGDAIFAKGAVVEADESAYADLNARFHALLFEAAGDALLSEFAARCDVVPFVSPAAVAFDRDNLRRAYELLSYAHRQHHAIVDAIRTRNPARAEALLREHAMTQEASLNFAGSPAS